jgi:hypothetical protein
MPITSPIGIALPVLASSQDAACAPGAGKRRDPGGLLSGVPPVTDRFCSR